ncbi:alpha/beta-hydrolase [Tilletiaria anomala UBC 951]|uniref:Alpha/beta-hydrolase n=1 Tax=Tilletiaria anomala (strain ATCC 24038 / CBS 436.72 / UBC 951) TaxID=1037660 RepID=A0A066VKH7_TILAU|nr:alpha/beta-hydrolase [Tilletiaria anomala UBC 951]KDN39259.1 alpha/beta-hydrolase [Tilletiaria anomala UBC 951]
MLQLPICRHIHTCSIDNPAHRFASFQPHPTHPHLVLCILEDRTVDTPSTIVNSLVLLDTSTSKVQQLVSGADFYAFPSFNPAGDKIAWVQWNHPSMPFWSTEIRVASFDVQARHIVGEVAGIAKGLAQKGSDDGEVMQQPKWMPLFGETVPAASPETLYFTSDRTGFGKIYSVRIQYASKSTRLSITEPELVAHGSTLKKGDMQQPAWSLGTSTYTILSTETIAVIITRGGHSVLGLIDLPSKSSLVVDSAFATLSSICATSASSIVVNACWHDKPGALVAVDLKAAISALKKGSECFKLAEHDIHVIRRTSNIVQDGVVGKEWFTTSEEIEFPTTLPNGKVATAHAVIFPPHSPDFEAPPGTSPPCRIAVHGGPTGAAQAGLNLDIAFWTSRGWMVCYVNYGGSTGYGRDYMNRLTGQWGVVDVEDCVAAAKYLGSASSGLDAATGAATSSQKVPNREAIYEAPTAKAQLECFETKALPDGSVEVSLRNHKRDWGIFSIISGLSAIALGASAAMLLFRDTCSSVGRRMAQGAFSLATVIAVIKARKVQKEVVKAIPGLGLQRETWRGLRWPWADRADAAFRVTAVSLSFTPRDRMVDLVVNEALKGWSVHTYVAAILKTGKLVPLFPNLQPRLPLVKRIYQAVYPALFPSASQGPGMKSGTSFIPRADTKKIVISGSSSGGYTVLAALCLHPEVFSAGTSRYGISELTALAHDSHKFESRYLLGLLGGSPEEVPQIYHDRSPLYMADRIRAPVLVLQGDLDKVVPPNQSEEIVKTMEKNKCKVKYILFEGEGHGFRQAENQKRALVEELKWYEDMLGIK